MISIISIYHCESGLIEKTYEALTLKYFRLSKKLEKQQQQP